MSKKPRLWPSVEPGTVPLVDNHTHLPVVSREIPRDSHRVALPLTEQLARAATAGVRAVITSVCDLDDVRRADRLLARWQDSRTSAMPPLSAHEDLREDRGVVARSGLEDEAAAYQALAQVDNTPDLQVGTTWSGSYDGALPRVYFAAGIHPNEAAIHGGYRDRSPDGLTPTVKDFHAATIDDAVGEVAALVAKYPTDVVAIGETGLDYYRTGQGGREAQIAGFRAQIQLAKELDLPLQIHDRQAHADVVSTLLADGAPERTIFHCFSGDRELAEICNTHRWYASIAGPISYPRNVELRDAVTHIDQALLLLETDAPYLTPTPWRGRPNASYLIGHTLQALAELRLVSAQKLADQIYATTCEMYALIA
ncbi:MAG: TatD family hydrolase [Bowdeniella nasicola]|nr:TatD family hydrolase [Bowdeniella nasicola]